VRPVVRADAIGTLALIEKQQPHRALRRRTLGRPGGWRKTEAQLPVYPPGLEGADRRPFRDRHDAEIDEVEMNGKQAMSMSHPAVDPEELWLEEVGKPYHSLVAAAVTERVVAAAFCYPADSWLRVFSTPVRRLIRRMRGHARWDDRLPAAGWRHSVVALTERSLLVFEFRIGRQERSGGELGPCLGRWPRDEISVEVRRTELKRSVVNAASPNDSLATERLKVLRLTANTPDGPLALDLPAAGQPGIKDFEQAVRSQGLRSDRPPGDPDE
jgi:hypothetical protein